VSTDLVEQRLHVGGIVCDFVAILRPVAVAMTAMIE
jgi:hypothetical protein